MTVPMVSYDVTIVNIACQGGGVATRLTADQLQSGSTPDLGLDRFPEMEIGLTKNSI